MLATPSICQRRRRCHAGEELQDSALVLWAHEGRRSLEPVGIRHREPFPLPFADGVIAPSQTTIANWCLLETDERHPLSTLTRTGRPAYSQRPDCELKTAGRVVV